jgi:hypothetical protein
MGFGKKSPSSGPAQPSNPGRGPGAGNTNGSGPAKGGSGGKKDNPPPKSS